MFQWPFKCNKMNRLLILVILCAFLKINGQNSVRVFYQLESKSNVKQDSADLDLYVLDIDIPKKSSKFYNYTYLKNDSVYLSMKKESDVRGSVNFDTRKMKYPIFNIGVLKQNATYEMVQILDGDVFRYLDGKDAKWSILSEKIRIGDYDCQKATATVGGRNWEVFFTVEISLPFGPYKFGGLPGLIVQAKDDSNSYIFTMVGLEKTNQKDFVPKIFTKGIKTTKEKYYKAFNAYKIDPVKKLRENIITYPDGDYMKLAQPLPSDYIKSREAKMKKYLLENDNYIEIKK